MKNYFIGILVMFVGHTALAQTDSLKNQEKNIPIRICAPSKESLLSKKQPLIIVKSHNEIISFSDTALSKMQSINPAWIKQIDVYKDSANTIVKYGAIAANGVIEITLNDEKYPNAFESIKKGNNP